MDCWNGTIAGVQSFIDFTGYTFPVLRNAGYLQYTGPGLYGIGPAAKHYFGKKAKDLNPVEAAFFSTILPAPKERYKQYCAGTLTKWTDDKIRRILDIMLKRDRLTQTEYDQAIATPLVFVKDTEETEDQCLKQIGRAACRERV